MGADLSAETWPPPPPCGRPGTGRAEEVATRREMDAVKARIATLQKSASDLEAEMDEVTTERLKFEALAAMLQGKGDGGVFTGQEHGASTSRSGSPPDAATDNAHGEGDGDDDMRHTTDVPPSRETDTDADDKGDGSNSEQRSGAGPQQSDDGTDKGGDDPNSPATGDEGEDEPMPSDEEGIKDWLDQTLKDNIIVYLTRQQCPFSNDARQLMSSAMIKSFGIEINIDTLGDEQCDALTTVVEETYQQYGFPVIWITGELHELARLKELHKMKRLTAFVEARQRAVDLSRHRALNLYAVEEEEEEEEASDASVAPTVDEGELPAELVHLHPDAPLCLNVTVKREGRRWGGRGSPSPRNSPAGSPRSAARSQSPGLMADDCGPQLRVDRTNLFAALGAERIWSMVAAFADIIARRDRVYSLYRGRRVTKQTLIDRYTAFLCERLGGPPGMSSHTALRRAPSIMCCPGIMYMQHEGLAIPADLAGEWLDAMAEAMEVAAIPQHVRPLLDEYFRTTAFHLRRAITPRPSRKAHRAAKQQEQQEGLDAPAVTVPL